MNKSNSKNSEKYLENPLFSSYIKKHLASNPLLKLSWRTNKPEL